VVRLSAQFDDRVDFSIYFSASQTGWISLLFTASISEVRPRSFHSSQSLLVVHRSSGSSCEIETEHSLLPRVSGDSTDLTTRMASRLDGNARVETSYGEESFADADAGKMSPGSIGVISGLAAGLCVCTMLIVGLLVSRSKSHSSDDAERGHEMMYAYETDFGTFQQHSEEDEQVCDVRGAGTSLADVGWPVRAMAVIPEECFV
jgi:hypothetical protein